MKHIKAIHTHTQCVKIINNYNFLLLKNSVISSLKKKTHIIISLTKIREFSFINTYIYRHVYICK